MSGISVIKSASYEQENINSDIASHFENLNIAADIRPDMKVLIKPNLLTAKRPEHAVTTNPAILIAIVNWLKGRGVNDITIADSSGGPYVQTALKTVYSACGLKVPELERYLNYDTSWESVPCPPDFAVRSFNIISPILKADYIINAAKLKTHSMTTISAGIKNLFGTIPGLQKPEMHYRFPNIDDFSNMLLELAQTVKPQLTVIDAVDAMEGNGPSGGTSRNMGLTFASKDIFTQDFYAVSLMGIDPMSVPMLRIAVEKGLASPDEIDLIGDSAAPAVPSFKLPDAKSIDFASFLPAFIRKPAVSAADRILRPVPKVNTAKCIGCGKCAESCPPGVITFKDGKAVTKRKGCISCFCCQEMCPVHAINISRIIKF